jgi:hypothetical protein
LLVLAATFEINFFVHTGVERIGRYKPRPALRGCRPGPELNRPVLYRGSGADPWWALRWMRARRDWEC